MPVGVDVVQRKAASGFLIVGMAGIQERKMLTKFIIYVLKIESISTFFLTTFFLTKLIWGFFFSFRKQLLIYSMLRVLQNLSLLK